MALDQSALLEVLDALKVADVGDRVRQAAETDLPGLIEAELTEPSAPRCMSAPTLAPTSATATAPGSCPRPRGYRG